MLLRFLSIFACCCFILLLLSEERIPYLLVIAILFGLSNLPGDFYESKHNG